MRYYRVLEDGYDCAFGSRFVRGGQVVDYPQVKLVLNRLVNSGIRCCSGTATTTRPTRSRPTGAR